MKIKITERTLDAVHTALDAANGRARARTFDALEVLRLAMGVNPAAFAAGIAAGRKPVKLACSLGASYDRAEILAPLRLAQGADAINAAYAQGERISCMTGSPVGEYYAALGVACLWSPNFRALVLFAPDGVMVTPRAYGVHYHRVPELLGAALRVSREEFAALLPVTHTERIQQTAELVRPGRYLYAIGYRAEVQLARPAHLGVRDLAPHPLPDLAFRYVWAQEDMIREIAMEKARAIPGFTESVEGQASDYAVRNALEPFTVRVEYHGVNFPVLIRPYIRATRTLQTALYDRRRVVLVESIPVEPRVAFIPYRDYPPVVAKRETSTPPSEWEAVAYAHEARFNGYAY